MSHLLPHLNNCVIIGSSGFLRLLLTRSTLSELFRDLEASASALENSFVQQLGLWSPLARLPCTLAILWSLNHNFIFTFYAHYTVCRIARTKRDIGWSRTKQMTIGVIHESRASRDREDHGDQIFSV